MNSFLELAVGTVLYAVLATLTLTAVAAAVWFVVSLLHLLGTL